MTLRGERKNQTTMQASVTVGRNDPCPCGSGKRYKQCHGTLGSTAQHTDGNAQTAPFAQGSSSSESATSAGALAHQGLAAHQRGDIEGAERAYRAALRADPEHPLALHYLGVVHFQRNRPADALPLLMRSAERVPSEPEFHNNHGLALAALDRHDEAIAAYRRTLELKPDHATASNNLGLLLQAMNRVGEAIAAYRRAIALAPEFAQAHWNLALALLANGEYAEGWREYEWRLSLQELGGRAPPLPAPRWKGEDLRGATLLLVCEQGIGDALQFIRFAAPASARGVCVVVRAPAQLVPLLATAPGVAAAFPDSATPPQCTAALPMLSLAQILGVTLADIDGNGYLRSDPALRADAVTATPSRTRRIGVAWAGAAHHLNDRRRSMPIASLVPLFELPGIRWFSLQKGGSERDIADVPAARAVVRLAPDTELARTAALIDTLDAVITVDTSIAHLAGALGKSVWVMLPFAPDWRWGIRGNRTPWYRSARLFRQPAVGDWTSVIADVRTALMSL